MKPRLVARLAAVAPLLLLAGLAQAQVQPQPVPTPMPPASTNAWGTPVAPPPPAATTSPVPGIDERSVLPADEPAPVEPEEVARLFVDACVRNEGRTAAVVDWALARGLRPVDPYNVTAAQQLLGGAPGSVLSLPASQDTVLLAAVDGDQCIVWAERQPGPRLKLALLRSLQSQVDGGARLTTEADNNLERAGAWRSVMQWRYRRAGARSDLRIGAVTTLEDAPSSQALNLAPAGPVAARDPDGVPVR